MCEKIVPQQDTDSRAVLSINRWLVSPGVGIINNVVVDKRGYMNHLDRSSELVMSRFQFAKLLSAKQQQSGAHPFPTRQRAAFQQLIHPRNIGTQFIAENVLDLGQVLRDGRLQGD